MPQLNTILIWFIQEEGGVGLFILQSGQVSGSLKRGLWGSWIGCPPSYHLLLHHTPIHPESQLFLLRLGRYVLHGITPPTPTIAPMTLEDGSKPGLGYLGFLPVPLSWLTSISGAGWGLSNPGNPSDSAQQFSTHWTQGDLTCPPSKRDVG